MTDKGKWMSLNGNWIPEDKSSHLFHNRGFLYGDGFFESMRFENGRIRSGEAHLHRIHRSLLLLEMSDASFPDLESLERQLGTLVEKNKFGAHVRVRISVFREGPGIYTPEVNKTSYLINMSQLEGPLRFPETGLRIGYYTRQAKARGPFSNIKSLSAQLYVMAGLHARKEGLDELLLINTSGHFIEGITSNVFIVYNGTLLTPPLTEGCVDGVMRKTLLNLADQHGIPFREQMISETEVDLASEILFTNAVRGIQWAGQLGEKEFSCQTGRKLFDLMMSEKG